MRTEPYPVDGRHAAVGGALIVVGAYVGATAVWTWLLWPDQHIDAPRLMALLFAWVAILGGWTLIQKWLDGEWFEGRKWSNDSSSNTSGGSSSDGGSPCDAGSGGSDGGSCAS